MRLALVGHGRHRERTGLEGGGVPAEFAIRGFHGVSLLLEKTERTAAILTDVFGYASSWQRKVRSRRYRS